MHLKVARKKILEKGLLFSSGGVAYYLKRTDDEAQVKQGP